MQLPALIQNHKGMLKGLLGAVVIIALGFYLVTLFKEDTSVTITNATTNQALLGQNLAIFMQAMADGNLNLSDLSYLTSYHARNAKDFSQEIPVSQVRGREDPFSPYAAPRSSR